jgi:hypothetical protein
VAPTILPSPLCLHFVYLLQASCPLHSLLREKAENWKSKNVMAESGVKASGAEPAYSLSVHAPNCLSFDSSSRHSYVPIRVFRLRYPSHTYEQQLRKKLGKHYQPRQTVFKCWRVIRMDMRSFQFVVGFHRKRRTRSNTRRGSLQATLPASCI